MRTGPEHEHREFDGDVPLRVGSRVDRSQSSIPPPPGTPAALPTVSLPKSGGAMLGLGEKFTVNAATGTAAFAVPLPVTAGRSGFGPQLTLTYDSGSGNGPYGVGWTLSLPTITRKTDKGLPRYMDGDESDVFVLSGAEDLVPILDDSGARVSIPHTVHGVQYIVRLYRPRVEGLFARIERWTRTDTGVSHWRTITRDDVTTLFGLDENSRIVDPEDARRVFAYLISLGFDDKGNATHYEYAIEDATGVDRAAAHETNRADTVYRTQRYVKRIRYANAQPYFPDSSAAGADAPLPSDWRVQIVFDYGGHDSDAPTPTPDRAWVVRPDPFSVYRSGFEVRTLRRCHRVLLFHDFPAEIGVDAEVFVRSFDFRYADDDAPGDPRNPIHTFLTSITQRGYRPSAAGVESRAIPPLEFGYTQPHVHPEVLALSDDDSRDGLPEGLDGSRFRWADLDGEGTGGILAAQEGGWTYKRNLSPINQVTLPTGERVARAHFGPAELVQSLPVPASLAAPQQLLDLTGSGRLDLAAFAGPTPGYFARTPDGDWEPLKTFTSLPRLDWSEPNLTFVDLTGDGRADVLITEDDVYTFYPSLGKDGFGFPSRVQTPWDEGRGPRVVLADETQTVFLADLSGDGLTDVVRVRNGEICYWPNLGYGRFGAKVTMDNAPRFADEDRFDPRRIRLADIDGSGTTDVLYIGDDGVHVCFNQSGNAWAAPHRLAVFPGADNLSAVQVVDLLGNGTACLVWSSPLPGESRAPLRYVDLMGSQKPHLLARLRNNLGAETRIAYAPSTRFYLEDKQEGRPWITRLPFPVQVVERVETYDWIGRSRFVTRYAYHHGFFDGAEREFRGFGLVDQWDTATHRDDALFPDVGTSNESAASFVPPKRTRTWFHTGALLDSGSISRMYATEYWVEPPLRGDAPAAVAAREAMLLPDTVTDPGLSADEMREACRALKGSILRVEVFGEDDTPHAEHPYSVSERNYAVVRVQPFGPNRHAVFLTQPRESLVYEYERRPDDPRLTHELTLEVDEFGNVRRSASIAYGRRAGHADPEPHLTAAFRTMLAHDQARFHVRAAEHTYTEPVSRPETVTIVDAYRAPLPCETITAELTGLTPAGARFAFEEMRGHVSALWTGVSDLATERVWAVDVDGVGAPPSVGRRIIERSRTLYRKDNLTDLLPLGKLDAQALPGETYQLALTAGIVTRVFGNRVTDAVLLEGGYVRLANQNDWWIPSGRLFYSSGDNDSAAQELANARAHFYQPRRAVDPFGAIGRVTYDDYDLLPISTSDALGNETRSDNDYRVMHPRRVIDANGNFSEAAFDALGQVVGTAAGGKGGEGDSLVGFESDLSEAAVQAVRTDPLADPGTLLGNATSRIVYDLFAYFRTRDLPTPDAPSVYTLARETHVSDVPNGQTTRFQHAFVYSDGFGRAVQQKRQAERGPVPNGGNDVSPRWVGSGWTIYNNKGNAVRTYEPFFSSTHAFEFNRQAGVSTVLFYDPADRVVATLHPDNRFEKTVFDAWRSDTWDANDTVLVGDPRADADVGDHFLRLLGSAAGAFTSWHDRRIGGALGNTPEERSANQDAAQKAAAHAETPATAHLDSLGRVCLRVLDNGTHNNTPQRLAERSALDAQGRRLALFDAVGRHVMEYAVREPVGGGGFEYVAGYDLAGRSLYQNGMDHGERRTLMDVVGNSVRAWDARGFAFRMRYDALRRLTHRFAAGTGGDEMLIERRVYGEAHADDSRNLKGRLFRQYDSAGVAGHERYDFKGNVQETTRQLARHVPAEVFPPDYRNAPDWSAINEIIVSPALDVAAIDNAAAPLLIADDRFTALTRFDALNRPTQMVTPHRSNAPSNRPSVIQPVYNEAALLNQVDVWIRQPAAPLTLLAPGTADLHAVADIAYNARGQRISIDLGNGGRTVYAYDVETFRLVTLTTTRPNADAAARTVQELAYAYDAAGNITRVRDTADIHNVVYFRNQRVDPSADYTYDALYRLTSASGREHLGLNGNALLPPQQPANDDSAHVLFAARGDGNAIGNYTEAYDYDPAGNILTVIHQAASGQWTRRYAYNETSLIAASETSNRLSASSLPGDNEGGPYSAVYGYDEHGNMTRMPHLQHMTWDQQDRLLSTSRQAVLSGTPETTFYSYDAGGQRLRKLTERQAAAGDTPVRKAERLYLAGLELYREYGPNGTTVTKERETLHIVDGSNRVAIIETRTVGADPAPAQLVRYQCGNHLGSAVLELDDEAAVISYEEYFPYGGTAYQAIRSATETPKRYRYTGRERDEESDLCYHGARYYAPWLARWIAADPIGIDDGLNIYRYVANNPVILRDEGGTQSTPFAVTSGDKGTPVYTSTGDQVGKDAGKVAKELLKPAKESPEVKALEKLTLDPALAKLKTGLEADWKKDKVPMIIGGVLVLVPTAFVLGALTVRDQKLDVPIAGEVHTREGGFALLSVGLGAASKKLFDDKAKIDVSYERKGDKERFGYQQTQPFLSETLKLSLDTRFGTGYEKLTLGLEYSPRSDTKFSISGGREIDTGKTTYEGRLGAQFAIAGAPFKLGAIGRYKQAPDVGAPPFTLSAEALYAPKILGTRFQFGAQGFVGATPAKDSPFLSKTELDIVPRLPLPLYTPHGSGVFFTLTIPAGKQP